MASARARLGAARRGVIGRQKKANVAKGIFSTLGTISAFAGTQAKKAESAWGEYEAGYKELGGDPADIDKGGWFSRTFKGPGEGEVGIGKKMYDRKAIQKTGGILGSDTGALLSEGTRKEYIARQGRDMTPAELRARSTTFGISGDPSAGGVGVRGQNLVTSEFASSRPSAYDPSGGVGFGGQIIKGGGYTPITESSYGTQKKYELGRTTTDEAKLKTEKIQSSQISAIQNYFSNQTGAPTLNFSEEMQAKMAKALRDATVNPTPENVSIQKLLNQGGGVGVGSTFGQGEGGVGVHGTPSVAYGKSQDELIQMSANVESSIGRYGSRRQQFQESKLRELKRKYEGENTSYDRGMGGSDPGSYNYLEALHGNNKRLKGY